MDWLNTHRTRTAPKFVPQVEGLEAREVPVANFRVQGNILFISAPTTRQFATTNIFIRDNGSNRINKQLLLAHANMPRDAALEFERGLPFGLPDDMGERMSAPSKKR